MLKKITAVVLSVLFTVAALAGCGEDTGTGNKYDYDLTNFSFSDGLDANGFFRDLKASDYVELPEYKGVTIPDELLVADEADVQDQIDQILAEFNTNEMITDVAVKDGDTVNIDYVGYMDGVAFDGGSTGGYGTDVTIGVTNYIDDFLEQLIGHMPGDRFDVEVTFPDSYPNNTDFEGKDAVFDVTINYIKGDVIQAELTDDIAAEYGFETVDDLKQDIADWLVSQQKSDFFTELIYQSTVRGEIPQSVLDFVICADLMNYQYYTYMYGVSMDEFMKSYVGYEDVADYIDKNQDKFRQSAVYCLAVQAIAEAEGLSVSDMDVSEAGLSDYVETYGMPYLKQYILQTITVPDFVVDSSVSG